MKPLINKVTFKSWCHPLLVVSAVCLLSGAPDPPPEVVGTLKKCLYLLHSSHSLSCHGTPALPKNVSQLCQQIDDLLSGLLLLPAAQRRTSSQGWAVKSYQCLLCVLFPTRPAGGASLSPLLRECVIEARGIYQAECVGKSEFRVVVGFRF